MKDLIGQRFGMLTVIRKTEQRKHRNIVWECTCDCGNTKLVSSSELTLGRTRSCGCLRKVSTRETGIINKRDITGERFGRLIAIRPTEKRESRSIIWECRCDCGNTAFVSQRNLKGKSTSSCGCLRNELLHEQLMKDMTGQRFGNLVTIEATEQRKGRQVVWRCLCDCGNVICVPGSLLIKGYKTSCGCQKKRKPENDPGMRQNQEENN